MTADLDPSVFKLYTVFYYFIFSVLKQVIMKQMQVMIYIFHLRMYYYNVVLPCSNAQMIVYSKVPPWQTL